MKAEMFSINENEGSLKGALISSCVMFVTYSGACAAAVCQQLQDSRGSVLFRGVKASQKSPLLQ